MSHGKFLRRVLAAVLIASIAWVSAGASAQVVMVEGARYESSVQLAGERLLLNGVGVRKRFVFDIYAGGLYVSQRAARTEDLVRQPGPKRVALRFLRDVDGELFVTSLHNGLKANHSEAELEKWKSQVDVLTRTIQTIALARRGDAINFEYTPQDGTRVTVNGVTRGPLIPGADFYAAVLRVWLGETPADAGLKKGMLGAG
ncbi:MAG TPA: chalcone isomerase family protein [Burkholderiaceae bacterium]|nr:chalcone isomerase family protein [Burkholderiaceae bacterium]